MSTNNPDYENPNEWECWLDEGHVWGIGHIQQLNSRDRRNRKKKQRLGFAATDKPLRTPGKHFPDVPHFDVPGSSNR